MNREEAHLRNEAKFHNLAAAKERNDRAMQGWLGDPPPPSRTYAPGEEHKWYKMMGAAQLLEKPFASPIGPSSASPTGPPLPLASRYAAGRPRGSSPTPT